MTTQAAIEADYQRANTLRMNGQFDQAEALFRSVLQHAPEHRDAAYSLAFMLREAGRLNGAAEAVATLWQHRPESADAALAALGFLLECSAQAVARGVVSDARERWPGDARIAAKAGEIALALGEFDTAAENLREALDRDPQQSMAWLRLAYCQRFAAVADADMQRFRRGWAGAAVGTHAHICSGFALGKALDDLGDYADAANVLTSANALAAAATPWRESAWQAFVAKRMRAAVIPTLPSDADFVPVFIVGLPRTGTTLVASSLQKYTEVRDRGELNWIGALHDHLQEQGQLHDPAALISIGEMIRTQMRRDDAPARFYIDKNPLNFRYLDFIAALFPKARIIHCRRSLRDTALSLWLQHFAHDDLGFSYALSSIAAMEKGYRSLMAHWRSRLPIDILDVDYEAFVSEPAAQKQRLAEFVGLTPLQSRDASQTPTEVVTTASVWQVRQPIHTQSVGRWRNYAALLPELVERFPERA